MDNIILHNYPQSPVAEKVRLGLGLKNLSWHNVLIPRVPPKPDLVTLTGGYRRTPVMQIGADVYCDSQCILAELEQRFPEPSYFPNNSYGLSWGLSRWGEQIFKESIKLILGAAGNDLPEDFAADRGRLYFGPDWKNELHSFNKKLSGVVAQLTGHLSWIEQILASSKHQFLLADQAGLGDLEMYYFIWFIRGRWQNGAEFLAQFKHLLAWEQRVKNIGHGNYTDLSANEALDIAKKTTVQSRKYVCPEDVQGLAPGINVSITADVDGGEEGTFGTIRSLTDQCISITRHSDQLGEVCVHFPRVGYRVERL